MDEPTSVCSSMTFICFRKVCQLSSKALPMFCGMVREPMVAERDDDLNSFQTTFGETRVGSSNLLFHVIASSSHYQEETEIRSSTYTGGIYEKLLLERHLETFVELIAPANRHDIPFSNKGTNVTPNVTGTSPTTNADSLEYTNYIFTKKTVVHYCVRILHHHR